jgi:hypothetical protein
MYFFFFTGAMSERSIAVIVWHRVVNFFFVVASVVAASVEGEEVN